VIVLDASAALSGLLNAGPARESLASEQLHAPHLVDSEVASGLRRHVSLGRIAADDGWAALDAWRRLGLTRYATHGLLERIWALRDNLSAYDAGYVNLARSSPRPGVVLPHRRAITPRARTRCAASSTPDRPIRARSKALELLPESINSRQGPERIQASVLLAVRGSVQELATMMALARVGWRDLLVNAGLEKADCAKVLSRQLGK